MCKRDMICVLLSLQYYMNCELECVRWTRHFISCFHFFFSFSFCYLSFLFDLNVHVTTLIVIGRVVALCERRSYRNVRMSLSNRSHNWKSYHVQKYTVNHQLQKTVNSIARQKPKTWWKIWWNSSNEPNKHVG